MKKRKADSRPVSVPAGLLIGALASMMWTVLAAALVAKLLDSEVMAVEAVGYAAMAILATASALGSLMAYGRIRKNRLPVCLGAGGVYYLCLLATTALFFGGQYSGMGVTAVVVLLASGLTGIVQPAGRGGKSKKRYRIPA